MANFTKEDGVASAAATLLPYIASYLDVCHLFVLNGPLETIYRCWMFLGRTCEHQAYLASQELIIGTLSVVHNDSSLFPLAF
ncbi:hypothetical protein ARMGADRAFT_1018063 [Armillaria gallica]|uniref:Uncharacterized protein n=1 Tax=Armillaria gallica TaxID=47427 RepID=A0A2H3CU71_ARMGA|nr:hypothetical protein ARMGADRAFT_1018063 [Armillaria gallica]